MDEKQDALMLLQIRQVTYSFLGSSFLNLPDRDHINTILHERLFEEFPLEINEEGYEQGLELLRVWTKENTAGDLDTVIYQLKQDYTALFLGPGHLLAAPWESVYLTTEKLTFGQPTMEVRESYLRHGWEFSKKNSEPDDHFGLEMEFMAKLIAEQYQKIEEGNNEEASFLAQEQQFFLREHLLKWSNEFTDNIINHAATSYYRGLAFLARSFLNWDHDHLKQLGAHQF